MLFNSLAFLVFFAIVTLLYFTLPHRFRWALLLAASCFFYMYLIPVYILILAFTIGVDYAAGILIEGAEGRRRRLILGASIAANISVLCFFKYFNFLNENLSRAIGLTRFHYPIPNLEILLPVGLSFHTFQAMSYTLEVHRGRQKAERHPGLYALYVMFYPQLVAGPIERPQNLLPQFREEHAFDYDRVTSGLRLMAWGAFKKTVVADRLALVVSAVYDKPGAHAGPALVLATVFFAFQIFCDFSAYSDIAVGAARVMGFRLMRNFERPYHATSVGEFWRRWHISLSTWFRDYVYIPLGGSRVSPTRRHVNVFTVFVLSGLWHGANWTFVAWGALHGVFLVVEALTRGPRDAVAAAVRLDRLPSLRRAAGVGTTFALVCLGWVFFRASSVPSAWGILSRLGTGWTALGDTLSGPVITASNVGLGVAGIVLVEAVQIVQARASIPAMFLAQPSWARWGAYAAVVLAILNLGVAAEVPFIYFQF